MYVISLTLTGIRTPTHHQKKRYSTHTHHQKHTHSATDPADVGGDARLPLQPRSQAAEEGVAAGVMEGSPRELITHPAQSPGSRVLHLHYWVTHQGDEGLHFLCVSVSVSVCVLVCVCVCVCVLCACVLYQNVVHMAVVKISCERHMYVVQCFITHQE